MRFGRIEVRPAQRQVLVDGQPAAITSRAYDLLWTLIQHRDRVITKSELLDLVWSGLVVEEHNLHTQVSLLRKVIGANTIATIPGRGYRFVVVAEGDGDRPPASPGAATGPSDEGHAGPSAAAAGRTALIGRDADLAALDELLRSSPVLTICGPGGIGKTTLARALINSTGTTENSDVAWVELSSVSDAAYIAGAVALALNIGEQAEATPATLCRALARRRALVVLDNCEHLIDAVADLVQMLLDAAPAIRFLATSREPLKLRVEQRYMLEG